MSAHKYTDLRSSGLVVKTHLHDDAGSLSSVRVLHLLQRFAERVEKLLPDAYEEEMFDRLKKNMVLAQEVAPSHDFENIECNGVRMILQHAEEYLSVADKKKKPEQIKNFLEVVKMLDIWFLFIRFHKDLETTSKDSLFNSKHHFLFFIFFSSYYRCICLPDRIPLILYGCIRCLQSDCPAHRPGSTVPLLHSTGTEVALVHAGERSHFHGGKDFW